MKLMTADQVRAALSVRDLTDPNQGPHAMQLLLDEIEQAVAEWAGIPVRRHRGSPVVPTADNYDRLGYPADAVARDERYSRYLRPDLMLRAHTTAMIPPLLDDLDGDALLSVPGMCYRRDAIDRQHVGQPHQLDLWLVRKGLSDKDFQEMAQAAVAAAVPGAHAELAPSDHPYTVRGKEIIVAGVEVGEGGPARPDLCDGLAMGFGLDRLLMLRKGIDDIRLLRSPEPRIAEQLLDLTPYRQVSMRPPIRRDLSVAVDEDVDAEQLGAAVREALGPDAHVVEEVRVLSETPGELLPPVARDRLGLRAGEKNVLLRIVLRDLEATLTDARANALRDTVYQAVHGDR
jgi:phenylalanyl-tRNA synthetase alpha chain